MGLTWPIIQHLDPSGDIQKWPKTSRNAAFAGHREEPLSQRAGTIAARPHRSLFTDATAPCVAQLADRSSTCLLLHSPSADLAGRDSDGRPPLARDVAYLFTSWLVDGSERAQRPLGY